MSFHLEPNEKERKALTEAVVEFLNQWYEGMASMPATASEPTPETLNQFSAPPNETGQGLEGLLALVRTAGESGINHPSGGHMSYIPNAGLYTGALSDFLAMGLNRYTGVAAAAPGMAAIEQGVMRWMCGLFGFGPHSRGILLSGGSLANFTAVVAARTTRLGDYFTDGVIYTTSHTHHSVTKSARLAGFRDEQIRVVSVDDELRMDPHALVAAIEEDRTRGLQPFLIVASAGTTDTGSVDQLDLLADVAKTHDVWLHVDGAYGGFFQLTERGAARFEGIERADSITVDPHKGLSLPFGVGALLVKEEQHLVEANRGRGAYLRPEDSYMGIRDNASVGPELSRPFRGLEVWLPLHLHGVAPFREALDSSLDLAEYAYERLQSIEGVETPWSPHLSIVAFRCEKDSIGQAALEAVNLDRTVHLSPTIVDDRYVLRFAILNRRTTREHIDHALNIIEKTLIG